jgi:hypothetical protein
MLDGVHGAGICIKIPVALDRDDFEVTGEEFTD